MHVCMCMYMYIYIYIYNIYIYTHICAPPWSVNGGDTLYIYIYIYIYASHICVYIHISLCMCIHICLYIFIYIYIYIYVCVYIHICMHRNREIHKYAHTYIPRASTLCRYIGAQDLSLRGMRRGNAAIPATCMVLTYEPADDASASNTGTSKFYSNARSRSIILA